MRNFEIVEQNGVRVLTTTQLAKAYLTDRKTITNNFNRNKNRYISNKHFICLEGEEKRVFLNRNQIDASSKKAAYLYLWTEKGALLHAKSLNTDKAWEVYDYLVDFYFRAKDNVSMNLQKILQEETPESKFPELSKEDMKRIGINRGIVMGIYRAEKQQAGQDIIDIYNRLSKQGKAMVWDLILGEGYHG